MSTTKDKVQSLLQQIPDDCSIEDIQYHLYVIEKVMRGLEVATQLEGKNQLRNASQRHLS
ncbi:MULTISPECIES: hypothetical protein [Nostocales]|uniref:hypothetical protein n=1 Tax=Nostocales TaxID=1161 RepID=UPI00168990E6|nr:MULTISPECIES: hypothetical protein [Nostocales]MBD2297257.1 hypothetical protein [Nostoc sp. FACHB-190]MBD2491067.1 hypothetical protein [Aulosira sp. FACHB-615]